MEWAHQRTDRYGFFDALGEDPFVLTGAYSILMGIEPYSIIDNDDETYLIKVAMMRKALLLRNDEIEATATLIGRSVAQHLMMT